MRIGILLDYIVILLIKVGTLSFAKKVYLRGWIGIGGIASIKKLPIQLVFDYCHIKEEI